MLACVDVAYHEGTALAGCILFEAWTDDHPVKEVTARIGQAAPYRAGEFFRRGLPAILAVLERVDEPLEAVVIDACVPVVGVAKTAWGGNSSAALEGSADERRIIPLRRGRSDRRLYVTSVGIDVQLAAKLVAGMHGAHRIPTLIKAADRLVRG